MKISPIILTVDFTNSKRELKMYTTVKVDVNKYKREGINLNNAYFGCMSEAGHVYLTELIAEIQLNLMYEAQAQIKSDKHLKLAMKLYEDIMRRE